MLLIFRNSAMTHMIRYSIRSLDFIFDMGNKIHLLLNFVLSSFLSFSLYIKFHTSTFFVFCNSSSIYILVPLFPKFVTYLFLIQIHTHIQNYLLSLYVHLFMVGNLELNIYQQSNNRLHFYHTIFSVSLYLALLRKAYCCDVLSVTSVSYIETTMSQQIFYFYGYCNFSFPSSNVFIEPEIQDLCIGIRYPMISYSLCFDKFDYF